MNNHTSTLWIPHYLADELPLFVHAYVVSRLHPFDANTTSKGVRLHLQFSCTRKQKTDHK